MSVYNHNHISNTTTESDALLIDSSHHHHHHHHTNHFVQVEPSSNLREEHSDLSVSGNVDGNDIDNTSEVNTSQNFKDNIDSEIFINGLKNEKIDNSVPVEFDPTIKISDNDIDDNDEEFVNNEKLLALECKEEINHDSDALLQEHTERVNEKQVTSDVAISEDCKTVNSSKPKEDFPGSENALKVVDNSPLLNTCEKFANNDSFSTSVVSNIQIESVPNLEDSDKTNEDPEIVSVSNPLVNNFEEHASNDSSAVEENIENVADKNLIDTELNETEKDFYDIEVKTVDLDKVQDHSLLNGPPDKSTFDTKSLNEFEEFEVQLSNGDTHPVEQNDPTDSKDINHQISPDLSFDVTNCQNAISVDRISETRMSFPLSMLLTGNVKDEELWPEESKPSSKAVFDDFEKMEKEVILEMEKENEEKNMKREGDKKGKKKKKRNGFEKSHEKMKD
ncbi:hypothetical protein Avbf_04530 [Armadillidium vulgare]|nr:hypothetical protein Avbf_04530 [Armadillidium vulgare]